MPWEDSSWTLVNGSDMEAVLSESNFHANVLSGLIFFVATLAVLAIIHKRYHPYLQPGPFPAIFSLVTAIVVAVPVIILLDGVLIVLESSSGTTSSSACPRDPVA